MDAWTRTLPVYFQPGTQLNCQYRWYQFARSRLWWRYWNLKIIVFRHILLRQAIAQRGQILDADAQSEQNKCKHVCIEAAHATIVSIQQYSTRGLTRLEGWYAT